MANSFCAFSRPARDFLVMLCVLERIVPHPKGFVCLSTGNSVDFPPQSQEMIMFVVRANFVGQKKDKQVDQNFVPQKITQLISRHLVRKTGDEAGTGFVRLLSKASNTGFSRHIKIGCNLPVYITTVY